MVDTGNGTLCAKCNKGVPSLTWGWQVEGFLLLSWCAAEVGGGGMDEGPLHEQASMEKMEGVLGTGDRTRGVGGCGGEVVQGDGDGDGLTASGPGGMGATVGG